MKKTAQKIYDLIDNDLYNEGGDIWWQPDSVLNLLYSSVNPARAGYFRKKLLDELNVNPREKRVLEVGCGGGILSEEIARMGFNVTGIDPSDHSLQIAAGHAREQGLVITYEKGTGEALPFEDRSFDIVFCCDVLEHVRDVPKVIAEISRVLRPGGIFCYDTINRTFMSKLVVIYIAQVWKPWAFAPFNLHVWEMFIRPDELKSELEHNNLIWKEHRGMEPNVSLPALLYYLIIRAMGKLTYKELGKRVPVVESSNMSIIYTGYAVKND